jgi:hypothetical protein
MSNEGTEEAIVKVCAPIVDEPDVLWVVLEPPPLPGLCVVVVGGGL